LCGTACHQKEQIWLEGVAQPPNASATAQPFLKTTLEDDMGLYENRASPFTSMVFHHFPCSHIFPYVSFLNGHQFGGLQKLRAEA
jgi:hypothetical protein